MNHPQIMIDIETLGNTKDCIPVTIGIVQFHLEPSGEACIDKHQISINPLTAQKAGLKIDAGTVMWWMQQSPEAQSALIDKNATSLGRGLADLALYLADVRRKNPRNQLKIWAQDPDFDCVIMQSAYEALDELPPWQFWETRSCRTMYDMGEQLCGFIHKRDMPRTGTHHNAADDAEHQALVIREIYKRLLK